MKIKVLFENENMLVLDKPANLAVHADGKREVVTLVDYILEKYPKLKGVGESEKVPRPGIVHRLDKDTSGCLILAKNQKSFQNLKHQFQTHKIKKEYVALVWGSLKHDTGIINYTIARSKTDFRKKEVVRVTGEDKEKFRGEEREALTRYKVLKRLELYGEKVTLVAFYPETGRTHQIRIHTKSIGHPIVADHLYGPENKIFEKKFFLQNKLKPRQLLHARSISFHNPDTGEFLKVESPLPLDMKRLV